MANRIRKEVHEGPHKYFRTEFKESGTKIYRCGLPDCPHFLYEPLIVGRISKCWRCPVEFIVTKRTLRSKKFHCEACTRGRYNKPREFSIIEHDSIIDGQIDKILGEVGEDEKGSVQ